MASHVMHTTMDPNCDPPSASLNPAASAAPRAIEVAPDVTDEDLEWLNAYSLGVRVERVRPKRGKAPTDASWVVTAQIRG